MRRWTAASVQLFHNRRPNPHFLTLALRPRIHICPHLVHGYRSRLPLRPNPPGNKPPHSRPLFPDNIPYHNPNAAPNDNPEDLPKTNNPRNPDAAPDNNHNPENPPPKTDPAPARAKNRKCRRLAPRAQKLTATPTDNLKTDQLTT